MNTLRLREAGAAFPWTLFLGLKAAVLSEGSVTLVVRLLFVSPSATLKGDMSLAGNHRSQVAQWLEGALYTPDEPNSAQDLIELGIQAAAFYPEAVCCL